MHLWCFNNVLRMVKLWFMIIRSILPIFLPNYISSRNKPKETDLLFIFNLKLILVDGVELAESKISWLTINMRVNSQPINTGYKAISQSSYLNGIISYSTLKNVFKSNRGTKYLYVNCNEKESLYLFITMSKFFT